MNLTQKILTTSAIVVYSTTLGNTLVATSEKVGNIFCLNESTLGNNKGKSHDVVLHLDQCQKFEEAKRILAYFENEKSKGKIESIDIYVFGHLFIKDTKNQKVLGMVVKGDLHEVNQRSTTQYYFFDFRRDKVFPLSTVYESDAYRKAMSLSQGER